MTPKDRIKTYFGPQCDILALHPAATSGSLFVVDAEHRGRMLRTLGSIASTGLVLEHSAMDRLRPDRLAYVYERMMLASLALVPNPLAVLLLGLGGGAMVRHLQAHLPDSALTIVERDPVVRDFARRYFHITHPIVAADAEEFIGDARNEFDVVMIDLYDPSGYNPVQDSFWRDCLAALRPGGCLAINWAGFLEKKQVRDEIARTVALVGRSFFIAQRDTRPNIVQYAARGGLLPPADLAARLHNFARRHGLPHEDRDILQRGEILTRVSGQRDAKR